MLRYLKCACWLMPALLLASVEDKQTIQKDFPVAKRVEIENINGYIHVTGHDGPGAKVTIHQSFTADTQEKLDEARRDIKVDASDKDGAVHLFIDGPFRCDCNCGSNREHHHGRTGYGFRHEFEVQVPRGATLHLHNVNGGDIKVENVSGDFDLSNVNGPVELVEASGSGSAHTVNGGVKAVFRSSPRAQTSFKSINGGLELHFPPELSADLLIKTFNGAVYSDFDVTRIANPATQPERRNGKLVYHANRFSPMRIGNGGPEIKLDGFNGDIRILKRGK